MDLKKLLLIAFGLALLAKYAHENDILPSESEDQTGGWFDVIPNSLEDIQNKIEDEINGIDMVQAEKNIAAFLWAIRKAEGTAAGDGYRALFGYTPNNNKTFQSYQTHPRIYFDYKDQSGKVIKTSAAGAYQITFTTFSNLANKYGFIDFSPESQDAMAVQLIDEKGALNDVKAGRFDMAINKIKKVWASMPNSNVNQPTRTYQYMVAAYTEAGGKIA